MAFQKALDRVTGPLSTRETLKFPRGACITLSATGVRNILYHCTYHHTMCFFFLIYIFYSYQQQPITTELIMTTYYLCIKAAHVAVNTFTASDDAEAAAIANAIITHNKFDKSLYVLTAKRPMPPQTSYKPAVKHVTPKGPAISIPYFYDSNWYTPNGQPINDIVAYKAKMISNHLLHYNK